MLVKFKTLEQFRNMADVEIEENWIYRTDRGYLAMDRFMIPFVGREVTVVLDGNNMKFFAYGYEKYVEPWMLQDTKSFIERHNGRLLSEVKNES